MAKATKKTPAKKTTANTGDFLENTNIVHALSYFPYFIGAVAMFFLGKTDKKAAMHHIKYSALIAAGVLILGFVLNAFFMKLLTLVYFGVSGYFAFKAFNGEEVKVEILDTIEDKISEKVKK